MTGPVAGVAGPANRRELVLGAGLSGWSVGPTDPEVVVVLVHGAMDRAASFGRLARRISEGPEPTDAVQPSVAAVAYDRRGYDASTGLGPATIARHAEDLAAVVEGLGDVRTVVLGHSLGGTILIQAVLDGLRPDVAAVFESPVPQLPSYRDDLVRAALGAAALGGPADAAETFSRAVLGDAAWDRLRPAFRSARRAEGPALCTELASLGSLRVDRWPVDQRTRIGRGATSGGYYAATAAELSALIGGASVEVLDGAGHGAHLSHPDACARWLGRQVAAAVGPRRVDD